MKIYRVSSKYDRTWEYYIVRAASEWNALQVVAREKKDDKWLDTDEYRAEEIGTAVTNPFQRTALLK